MTKICIISEGTYPIAIGGVSKWIHTLLNNLPDFEFEIISLVPDNEIKVNYKLPKNVKKVHFIPIWDGEGNETEEYENRPIDNYDLRKTLQFFKPEIVKFSNSTYLNNGFIKPLMRIFNTPIPKADIYHTVNAGYAGLMGVLAKKLYRKPLIVTEHGSYYKEWVLRLSSVNFPDELKHPKFLKPNDHKQIKLLKFIAKLTNFSFINADSINPVTSSHIPLEVKLGADPRKIKVIPNGVDTERFSNDEKEQDKK
ncbi:MAG: DUF3492 domain-containing protein, partial [Candidatus Odinarchaeia archaeon]